MVPVKVFLDTNIVLDFFTGRMNDGLAAKLIQVGRSSQFEMCISFLTAINTMYIAKKLASTITPDVLTRLFTILPQDAGQWKDAAALNDVADFEDAVQISCALNNSCYIAISRDQHFTQAPMPVFTPEAFLEAITK